MTTVYTLVIYLNFLLITLFFIRIITQIKEINFTNFYAKDLLVYHLLTYGYYNFKIILNGSENHYNFLSIFIPLWFTYCQLIPYKKINTIYVVVYSFLGILLYYNNDKYCVVALYIFSIASLISKSIFLSKKRANFRKIAIIYITLSLAQLLSLTHFLMHKIEFNWKYSIYLKYYSILPLIMYPTLSILTHVKFRRLFHT